MVPCQQLTAQGQEMETFDCKCHVETSRSESPPRILQHRTYSGDLPGAPQTTSQHVGTGRSSRKGMCQSSPHMRRRPALGLAGFLHQHTAAH